MTVTVRNRIRLVFLPRIGFRGVEKIADIAAWRNSIAECGTENGWANAWNAEPQVI